jgi:hypothetical protein
MSVSLFDARIHSLSVAAPGRESFLIHDRKLFERQAAVAWCGFFSSDLDAERVFELLQRNKRHTFAGKIYAVDSRNG